ncbi:hypothetical protein EUGRSUZ_H05011 [Eucalyptus grandis]|uniref:Uncharacterized protein n=2 Tax=Eucalyptus grandis TaxID=71139 RepID=A0ACC3K5J4_EUCGR|nr:hypothetical protein EUGRSUZ_H05011 [Eucalyptus grandis]
MESIQKAVRDLVKDVKLSTSRPPPPPSGSTHFGGEGRAPGVGVALSAAEHPPVLFTRNPRGVVSLWTCSKLCAISLVAGVFLGYTLKRRVRGWVSKLLRRLKDD